MPILPIDDPADSRIADYCNVPDPELIERDGIFIAEGRLVVRRLLTGGRLGVRSVMVTEAALASLRDVLDPPLQDVYLVSQAVMNAITGFNMHRGCLAIGERPPLGRWRELVASARRLVAIERVANADNVGSIFRNAAAFGVDAVLLGPGCTDPLYRKAIRTSMGAALAVPFAHADPWPSSLTALREMGFAVVALTPDADAMPLPEFGRAVAGRRIALVAGHEGEGLTADVLAACEHHARIPMATGVDSLNVATALAIAVYELDR